MWDTGTSVESGLTSRVGSCEFWLCFLLIAARCRVEPKDQFPWESKHVLQTLLDFADLTIAGWLHCSPLHGPLLCPLTLCSVQLPPAALFPLQPLLHPSAHNMLGVGEAMWCHFYPNVKKFFLNSRNREGFWDTYLKAKLVDSCSCMLSKLMALFYFAFYVLWMVEIFDTFFFLLVENWCYFICNQIKVNVACTAGKQVTLQEHGWAARLLTDVFVTIKHFFKGICSNT